MSNPLSYVLVVTKSFRDVLALSRSAGVPTNQLIHAYRIQKIRGLQRGMKYVVLGDDVMHDYEEPILEFMASRENIEIQPEEVRAAVLGEAA